MNVGIRAAGGPRISDGDPGSRVILVRGGIGAGKTTTLRELARSRGQGPASIARGVRSESAVSGGVALHLLAQLGGDPAFWDHGWGEDRWLDRLPEALGVALASAVAGGTHSGVVVVDDAEHGDATSLHAVGAAVAAVPGAVLLLAVGGGDLTERQVLERVAPGGPLRRIELTPWGPADCSEMVRARWPQAGEPVVLRLHRLTAGNPLLLRALLRAVDAGPDGPSPDQVSAGVHDAGRGELATLLRLRFGSGPDLATGAVAALLDGRSSLGRIARLTGTDASTIAARLLELVEAGVLVADSQRRRPANLLWRAALLNASARQRVGGDGVSESTRAGVVAALGGLALDPALTAAVCRLVDDLRPVPGSGDRHGSAPDRSGDTILGGRQLIMPAVASAWTACLTEGPGQGLASLARSEASLRQAGVPIPRGWRAHMTGLAVLAGRDPGAALDDLCAAPAAVDRPDHRLGLGLRALREVLVAGDAAAAATYGRSAVGRPAGSVEALLAHHWGVLSVGLSGDPGWALARCDALVAQLGGPDRVAGGDLGADHLLALVNRAMLRFRAGALAGAEADCRAVLRGQLDLGLPSTGTIGVLALSTLIDVLVERDQLAQVGTLLARHGPAGSTAGGPADARPGDLPGDLPHSRLRAARARWRLAGGDAEGAFADLSACHQQWRTWQLPGLALVLRGGDLALAAAACGHPDLARRQAAAHLALAERWGVPAAVASALAISGQVTPGAAGRAQLARAARLLIGTGATLEQATVYVRLGSALRRSGRRVASRGPLRRGIDLATGCGMTRLGRWAESELRLATGRGTATGRLTEAQLRVAALAAQGLRYRDVAARLGVSIRTVETHLGSVYRRLQLSGQADLIASVRAGKVPELPQR